MMKIISITTKPFYLFIVLAVAVTSCKTKTNFNDLTEVSYVQHIAPIISSNCAFSGCHGDSAFVRLSLTTYTTLINGGIDPGRPEKSKLYKTLKSLDDDIMPKKPYNPLSDKQIQLIYVWIGQGAKNN